MLSTFEEKVRFVFKALVTALLFSLQSIVYGGWAISLMAIPLLPYLVGIVNEYMSGQGPNLERDLYLMLFARVYCWTGDRHDWISNIFGCGISIFKGTQERKPHQNWVIFCR